MTDWIAWLSAAGWTTQFYGVFIEVEVLLINKKLSCRREAAGLCLSVVSFNSTVPRAHY